MEQNLSFHLSTKKISKKSAALRLIVPKLDFKSSFDDTVKDVEMCFESISKLTEISEKLPISEITELIQSK